MKVWEKEQKVALEIKRNKGNEAYQLSHAKFILLILRRGPELIDKFQLIFCHILGV